MFSNLKTKFHIYLINRFSVISRQSIADKYLNGTGLEIGAMNLPLIPKRTSKISYLDRCSHLESEKIFPDLGGKLVPVDIIADIDNLGNLDIGRFDFIIANHVFEHLENPISFIFWAVNCLNNNGKLFMALPDKRFTFDAGRKITSNEHLFEEFENGFEKNRTDHYFDFVSHTEHGIGKTAEEINLVVDDLIKMNFSIHFHVCDYNAYLSFFLECFKRYNIPLSLVFSKSSDFEENCESIFVFCKNEN